MLLRPGVENREYWFMFTGIDKVLHISIFTMLGFLFTAVYPRMRFLKFIYIMALYAFVTEILQDAMRLGRSAETYDIVADMVGVLAGYYIYRYLKERYLT